VEVLGRPRELDAQQRPGRALEHRAVDRGQERPGERGRAHQHLLALADLEAVVAQELGEAARVGLGHGASSSGKCSATCARSVSRIQARSAWLAKR
jgi:hypothetical protein